jgi:hypothetical protein
MVLKMRRNAAVLSLHSEYYLYSGPCRWAWALGDKESAGMARCSPSSQRLHRPQRSQGVGSAYYHACSSSGCAIQGGAAMLALVVFTVFLCGPTGQSIPRMGG